MKKKILSKILVALLVVTFLPLFSLISKAEDKNDVIFLKGKNPNATDKVGDVLEVLHMVNYYSIEGNVEWTHNGVPVGNNEQFQVGETYKLKFTVKPIDGLPFEPAADMSVQLVDQTLNGTVNITVNAAEPRNRDVEIEFANIPAYVLYNIDLQGAEGIPAQARYGEKVLFTYTIPPNHQFAGYDFNPGKEPIGQPEFDSVNNKQYFIMPDHEVKGKLNFLKNCKLEVEVNNPEFGTVTGAGTYIQGTNVTVNATPKEGYEFVEWVNSADDSIINSNESYTFNITDDIKVKAIFREKTKVEVLMAEILLGSDADIKLKSNNIDFTVIAFTIQLDGVSLDPADFEVDPADPSVIIVKGTKVKEKISNVEGDHIFRIDLTLLKETYEAKVTVKKTTPGIPGTPSGGKELPKTGGEIVTMVTASLVVLGIGTIAIVNFKKD